MDGKEIVGRVVLNASVAVHTELGPGLLERVYEACLVHELVHAGLRVRRQVALPVRYKGLRIATGFRLDLLVNESVVVELKTFESLNDVHFAQLLSYLRLGGYKLGYLLNFNVSRMKQGIRRVVN